MKTFLILVCSLVACAVGYWAEPSLRPHLTAQVSAKAEDATPKPAATEVILRPAPEKETGELLPEKVTLREKVEFNDVSSGLTMTLAAGSEARLLRIKGDEAVIRIGESKYTFAIPISQTDLAVRLGKEEPSAEAPVAAPADVPAAAPADVATTEVASAAEPAADTDAGSAEEAPVIEVPAEDTAEPAQQQTTETTPEPAAAPAGPTDVVEIMRESLRNREIKKFEFEQVKDWQPGADETIEGQTFQTGTLTYEAETIFGAQTIQAKAFIQNGKVVRWIWPKSGVQIE